MVEGLAGVVQRWLGKKERCAAQGAAVCVCVCVCVFVVWGRDGGKSSKEHNGASVL
jgi:hypothetical protein